MKRRVAGVDAAPHLVLLQEAHVLVVGQVVVVEGEVVDVGQVHDIGGEDVQRRLRVQDRRRVVAVQRRVDDLFISGSTRERPDMMSALEGEGGHGKAGMVREGV